MLETRGTFFQYYEIHKKGIFELIHEHANTWTTRIYLLSSKIESARLGSEPFQLGKFQFELITSNSGDNYRMNNMY